MFSTSFIVSFGLLCYSIVTYLISAGNLQIVIFNLIFIFIISCDFFLITFNNGFNLFSRKITIIAYNILSFSIFFFFLILIRLPYSLMSISNLYRTSILFSFIKIILYCFKLFFYII